jgi:hypothetical protein
MSKVVEGQDPARSATLIKAPQLGDPLRTCRRWLGRLIFFGSLVSVGFILHWILGAMQREARFGPLPILSLTFLGLSLPLFVVAWSVLPRRKTNAFYLRSFRTDRQTWPIRQTIQSGLGRKYRLSGIRDPRRRRSPLDYGGYAIFLLRYSTT